MVVVVDPSSARDSDADVVCKSIVTFFNHRDIFDHLS